MESNEMIIAALFSTYSIENGNHFLQEKDAKRFETKKRRVEAKR